MLRLVGRFSMTKPYRGYLGPAHSLKRPLIGSISLIAPTRLSINPLTKITNYSTNGANTLVPLVTPISPI